MKTKHYADKAWSYRDRGKYSRLWKLGMDGRIEVAFEWKDNELTLIFKL
jgi:hypothetical protein